MNSTNSQGSPFSYAVPDQDNELLIYYSSDKFQLYIGGESRLCENYDISGKKSCYVLMFNAIPHLGILLFD